MFVSIDHLELNTIFIEISPNNSLSRKATGRSILWTIKHPDPLILRLDQTISQTRYIDEKAQTEVNSKLLIIEVKKGLSWKTWEYDLLQTGAKIDFKGEE